MDNTRWQFCSVAGKSPSATALIRCRARWHIQKIAQLLSDLLLKLILLHFLLGFVVYYYERLFHHSGSKKLCAMSKCDTDTRLQRLLWASIFSVETSFFSVYSAAVMGMKPLLCKTYVVAFLVMSYLLNSWAIKVETWWINVLVLHMGTMLKVRVGKRLSKAFYTSSGVRQGCVLAPAYSAWQLTGSCPDAPAVLVSHSMGQCLLTWTMQMMWYSLHRIEAGGMAELERFDDAAKTMGLHTLWEKTKLQNIGYELMYVAYIMKWRYTLCCASLQVYWRVIDRLSPRSTQPLDISVVLDAVEGRVVCPAERQLCTFQLTLIDNEVFNLLTWRQCVWAYPVW